MQMLPLLISVGALALAPAIATAADQAASASAPATGQSAITPPPTSTGDLRRDNGFMTGEELFRRCTDPSPNGGVYCFGYIAAVNDSVKAYERWLNVREYCVQSTVTLAQLRDVFVDEGRNRPTALRGQAASFVVNAFKRHFPC